MKRKIIEIDAALCNGCGLCVDACHEEAIGLKEGKAVLLREDYCDGLGDCLPACPTNAIRFVEREAAAYDHAAVQQNKQTHHQGCPGSAVQQFSAPDPSDTESVPATASALRQWPVQIKLVPPNAPWLENADLLIAADCTAFCCGDFHTRFIQGRRVLIGCPKLDAVDYTDKLRELFAENAIHSITVVRMSVPCCGGLEHAVKTALQQSGKQVPLSVQVVTPDGNLNPA